MHNMIADNQSDSLFVIQSTLGNTVKIYAEWKQKSH